MTSLVVIGKCLVWIMALLVTGSDNNTCKTLKVDLNAGKRLFSFNLGKAVTQYFEHSDSRCQWYLIVSCVIKLIEDFCTVYTVDRCWFIVNCCQ